METMFITAIVLFAIGASLAVISYRKYKTDKWNKDYKSYAFYSGASIAAGIILVFISNFLNPENRTTEIGCRIFGGEWVKTNDIVAYIDTFACRRSQ